MTDQHPEIGAGDRDRQNHPDGAPPVPRWGAVHGRAGQPHSDHTQAPGAKEGHVSAAEHALDGDAVYGRAEPPHSDHTLVPDGDPVHGRAGQPHSHHTLARDGDPGGADSDPAHAPDDGSGHRRTADSDRKIVEAIMLLAEDPIPARQIGEVLERPRAEVEGLLRDLAAEYERDDRGFVLRATAGGWRLYTNPDCHPWLERFVTGHAPARLTGAAMEALAIIAYRGPLSRAQIAEIRGVDSDGVVRTLVARGLIEETGRDSGPGTPVLFGVTRNFLEGMGLRSLDELPSLKDFMPDSEAVEEMEARLSPNV